MLNWLRRGERGQSLVVIALALPALLAVTALVCDIGYAYVVRRKMQNAADAGALAGTRALHLGENAEAVARDYAQRNGAQIITVEIDEEAGRVRVTCQANSPTFFANALGLNEPSVATRSAARTGAVSELSDGVYPIAVDWHDFEYGSTYDIFVGGGPGNFGWLSWDGCVSTPCLCNNLNYPGTEDRLVAVGDWVPGSTGVVNSSCVRNALDYLVNLQIPITIIVYDMSTGEGSHCDYRIAGFAQFIIEDYRLPSSNRITGRFLQWVVPTKNIHFGPGYGVVGSKLTE